MFAYFTESQFVVLKAAQQNHTHGDHSLCSVKSCMAEPHSWDHTLKCDYHYCHYSQLCLPPFFSLSPQSHVYSTCTCTSSYSVEGGHACTLMVNNHLCGWLRTDSAMLWHSSQYYGDPPAKTSQRNVQEHILSTAKQRYTSKADGERNTELPQLRGLQLEICKLVLVMVFKLLTFQPLWAFRSTFQYIFLRTLRSFEYVYFTFLSLCSTATNCVFHYMYVEGTCTCTCRPTLDLAAKHTGSRPAVPTSPYGIILYKAQFVVLLAHTFLHKRAHTHKHTRTQIPQSKHLKGLPRRQASNIHIHVHPISHECLLTFIRSHRTHPGLLQVHSS